MSQLCDEKITVVWIHFIPNSIFLQNRIDKLNAVYEFNKDMMINNISFKHIINIFDDPDKEKNQFVERSSLVDISYTSSLILFLISRVLEVDGGDKPISSAFLRIKNSISYMNENYRENISIDDIAKKSYLNTSYFIRLFKKTMKVTPNQYILNKKLEEACNLLLRSNIPISEISESLGF